MDDEKKDKFKTCLVEIYNWLQARAKQLKAKSKFDDSDESKATFVLSVIFASLALLIHAGPIIFLGIPLAALVGHGIGKLVFKDDEL